MGAGWNGMLEDMRMGEEKVGCGEGRKTGGERRGEGSWSVSWRRGRDDCIQCWYELGIRKCAEPRYLTRPAQRGAEGPWRRIGSWVRRILRDKVGWQRGRRVVDCANGYILSVPEMADA